MLSRDIPFSDGDGEEITLTIPATEDGHRADAAIAALTELSRSAAARLMEEGAITRGGEGLNKKSALRAGDVVRILLPPPVPDEAQPEAIPLDIVYEDEDIIVINKPKGMVVHPAPGHEHGTLVSALLYHCGESLSGIGGVARPGIVHRIDRDTTGLICAAKNDRAHLALSEQLSDHTMHRQYEALVVGRLERGVVDAPIARHPKDRKKMAIVPGGRRAVTHYTCVESWGQFSHVALRLETGRTHQIRLHMSHIGHPVMGDELYGANRTPFEKRHAAYLTGQALHAAQLSLIHPRTGKAVTFEAPRPAEMTKLIELLRSELS